MSIDDVQEMVQPEPTLHERVAKRRIPFAITANTQHLGNRIIRRFYPEHWAAVQIARHTAGLPVTPLDTRWSPQ